MSNGGGEFYLLLETGFRITLEPGDGSLLLEIGKQPWTEQPAPGGVWAEQSAPSGNWVEQPTE